MLFALYLQHVTEHTSRTDSSHSTWNERILTRIWPTLLDDPETHGQLIETILARPDCPEPLATQTRTHRSPTVRALYYRSPHPSPDQLITAARTDRSIQALNELAAATQNPAVIAALVERAETGRNTSRLALTLLTNPHTSPDQQIRMLGPSQAALPDATGSERGRWREIALTHIDHLTADGALVHVHAIALIGRHLPADGIDQALNLIADATRMNPKNLADALIELLTNQRINPTQIDTIRQLAERTPAKLHATIDDMIALLSEQSPYEPVTADQVDQVLDDPDANDGTLADIVHLPTLTPDQLNRLIERPNTPVETVIAALNHPNATAHTIRTFASTIVEQDYTTRQRLTALAHNTILSDDETDDLVWDAITRVNYDYTSAPLCLIGLARRPDRMFERLTDQADARPADQRDQLLRALCKDDRCPPELVAQRIPVRIASEQYWPTHTDWVLDQLTPLDDTGLTLVETLWATYEGTLVELITLATT